MRGQSVLCNRIERLFSSLFFCFFFKIKKKMKSSLFILVACIISSIIANDSDVEKIQETIFKSDYIAIIRPPGTDGNDFVTIKTNMFVLDITSIDDYEMQYTVQIYLRQKWLDKRLRFDHISKNVSMISISDVEVMWTPDTFFVNEIDGNHHKTVKTNQFARIYSDGSVLYSVKFTLILSCPMWFHVYPFDYQRCPMRIESYGWSKKDLYLSFDSGTPVQLNSDLRLNEFDLIRVYHQNTEVTVSTGTYSNLDVQFLLKRRIKYYFLHLYIPTAMLVFTSWSTFWFHPSQVVARTIIGMSTLFTTTNLVSGFNNSVPKVNYLRALDIWSGTCLTFIFAAFLEFIYVSYKHNIKSSKADQKSEEVPKLDQQGNEKPLKKWIQRVKGDVNAFDTISRSLFPIVFSVFVVLYFGIYMNIY